jgi:hypothetical protein
VSITTRLNRIDRHSDLRQEVAVGDSPGCGMWAVTISDSLNEGKAYHISSELEEESKPELRQSARVSVWWRMAL